MRSSEESKQGISAEYLSNGVVLPCLLSIDIDGAVSVIQ